MPWRLWERSKKLFWDPADLDFSQDAVDWQGMSDEERTLVALSARGFMVGEEAVTLDIVPLLRCMSDLGRLEDTMYLSMFAMEEAKHTEMFRRWFDAVGLDPSSLDDLVRAQQEAIGQRGQGVFDGALTKVMRRLDTDRSPRHRDSTDVTLIYNQLVEGVAAIAGYHRWDWVFRRLGKLAGLEAGIKLTQGTMSDATSRMALISDGVSSPRIPISGNGRSSAGEADRPGFGGGYGARARRPGNRARLSATTTNTGSG